MKLRHHFFPSRANHFHPTILRPIGLFLVSIVLAATPLVYNVSATKQFKVLGYATSISIGDLNLYSNNERRNVGLGDLSLNAALNNAAAAKAQDMFAKDYWAHDAPDGKTPWQFMLEAGYSYSTAGENLAMNFNTSADTVAGWMASPGHKANILNNSYVDVGFAAVNGTLQGQQTTLVVAMYGSPQAQYTPPPPAAAPQQSTPAPPAPTSQPVEVPAPEPTPVPTPEPEPAASPAPQPTAQPVAQTAAMTDLEERAKVAGLATALPVQVYTSLNWGQRASIVLLSTLMLLLVMKHTMVWRQQRKGLRDIWLRAHPVGQFSILAVAFVVTLATGTGTIL